MPREREREREDHIRVYLNRNNRIIARAEKLDADIICRCIACIHAYKERRLSLMREKREMMYHLMLFLYIYIYMLNDEFFSFPKRERIIKYLYAFAKRKTEFFLSFLSRENSRVIFNIFPQDINEMSSSSRRRSTNIIRAGNKFICSRVEMFFEL